MGFTDDNLDKYSRVKTLCAEHFEKSQFTNRLQNALNWNAVPTLFSVKEPVAVMTFERREAFVQCPPDKIQPSVGKNENEKSKLICTNLK